MWTIMFNYSFNSSDGDIVIKTPQVNNFNDIKKEIKQTADCIINHSIYPNGLDITMSQLADKIIISSNKELLENDDGTYSFKD
mgnify:CR=1 FL=1